MCKHCSKFSCLVEYYSRAVRLSSRMHLNYSDLVGVSRTSRLPRCSLSTFYNFWLSWEGQSTLNLRYMYQPAEENRTSWRWHLLLSADFPEKFGFEDAIICLNGSVTLLDQLPEVPSTAGEYIYASIVSLMTDVVPKAHLLNIFCWKSLSPNLR